MIDAIFSWNGYDFDTLNRLDENGYIYNGGNPSKVKYVGISGKDVRRAKELLAIIR